MPTKATTKTAAKKTAKTAAKKTAKKTAKTAAKKTTKKASSKSVKLLVCAPDDQCFWTTDGQVLKNLEELKLAFGSMGDEVYLHHVNKEKNDFADWVEYVLMDRDCALALRKSKKPASAKTVVVKYLKHYHA